MAQELVPYYQPIIDLATSRLTGVECLCRWVHPRRGPIAPDFFIPVAERSGLIDQMFRAMLVEACRDARRWPAELSVSINVSPVQLLDPEMPLRLLGVLAAERMSPNRLIVELTESTGVADNNLAARSLSCLRAAGVRVTMDDFGMGGSDMLRLHRLPFDGLKLDRSFITLADTGAGRVMLHAIFAMAAQLGLATTAEGIERDYQAAVLHAMGCGLGQGFLFGRPVPMSKLPIDNLAA